MEITTMEKLRRERGMTRAELARRACVQPNIITWVEQGRFVPYESQLEKLAGALGVDDPGTLLDRVEV